MKKIFGLLLVISFTALIKAQLNNTDTNYINRVVSVEWMPDGKAILLAVVRHHKTDRQAPFFSKIFKYDLSSKKIEPLFDNGSNLAPSPDGKVIAFIKRNDNKRADIYFYDIETKQESVFKTDTTKKSALGWSPDGKYLMYTKATAGINQYVTLDVCIVDIATKKVKQITQSGKDKSYNPVWCPDSKKIVYYLEKGDNHDQIYVTDINGSFHTNLTNDTTTHNYFPCWLNEQTIIYTQDPETIMTMNVGGSNRQKVEGVKSFQVKYNSIADKLVYVTTETDNKVILFDWKKKTNVVLLDETKIYGLMK